MTQQYTFTKEIIKDSAPNKAIFRKHLCLYKIVDNEGKTAAQFYYYPKKQFIKIDGKEITVSVIEKFLKKSQYRLMENNKQVGDYKFYHSGLCIYWQDVPSDPNGTVTFNNMVYNFRRISSGVRSLPFKKDTWGYFKFRLYAVRGDAYAEYNLKMHQLTWQRSGSVNHYPFTGTIETNAENELLIVSAFYLMERVFATLDDTDSIG